MCLSCQPTSASLPSNSDGGPTTVPDSTAGPAQPAGPAVEQTIDKRGRRYRGTDSYDDIEPDLAVLATMDPADHDRETFRQNIIARCLPLADHIARRFGGRGEPADDVAQVARIGLIHAVDRFDSDRGSSFVAFAVPTVMGEVRRHFRDNTWAVRVPRHTKEIQLMINDTVEHLAQRLGRMPRTREIAAELEVDVEEVTRALIAANGYQTTSVTAASDGDDTGAAVSALLGAEEPKYERVEQFLAVQPLIRRLPERERQILGMRFFEYRTQSQIARALGISQMQVSRILSRTLTGLRDQVLTDPPVPRRVAA